MVIIPEEPIGIFVLEKIPVERRSSVGPHERLELLLGENELAMIVGPLTLRSRDVNSASASDVLIATSIDQNTLVFPSMDESHASAHQNAAAIAIGLRDELSLRIHSMRGKEEVITEPAEPNLSPPPHLIGYHVHKILVISRGRFIVHRTRHTLPKHPRGRRPAEKGGKSARDPPVQNPGGICQLHITLPEQLKRLLQIAALTEQHMCVHDERNGKRRVDIVQHAGLELRRGRSQNIRGMDGDDHVEQLEEF